jgi:hypothetical protein
MIRYTCAYVKTMYGLMENKAMLALKSPRLSAMYTTTHTSITINVTSGTPFTNSANLDCCDGELEVEAAILPERRFSREVKRIKVGPRSQATIFLPDVVSNNHEK